MAEVTLEGFRETCESWDEEEGCLDDYPAECPLHEACQRDAEGTEEELVPA